VIAYQVVVIAHNACSRVIPQVVGRVAFLHDPAIAQLTCQRLASNGHYHRRPGLPSHVPNSPIIYSSIVSDCASSQHPWHGRCLSDCAPITALTLAVADPHAGCYTRRGTVDTWRSQSRSSVPRKSKPSLRQVTDRGGVGGGDEVDV